MFVCKDVQAKVGNASATGQRRGRVRHVCTDAGMRDLAPALAFIMVVVDGRVGRSAQRKKEGRHKQNIDNEFESVGLSRLCTEHVRM